MFSRLLLNMSMTLQALLGSVDVAFAHKPTTRHPDPHTTSTEHSNHCDNLLLSHFGPVTFYCCDTLPPYTIHSGNRWPPLKVWLFFTVLERPPFFYLDCDMTSKMWTFCNMSLDHSWGSFGLFLRGVEKMLCRWSMKLVLYQPMDWLGAKPSLTLLWIWPVTSIRTSPTHGLIGLLDFCLLSLTSVRLGLMPNQSMGWWSLLIVTDHIQS